jgi:hypothetical protein
LKKLKVKKLKKEVKKMTNATEIHTPEITPEVGDGSVQIFLPFSITWENQEYEGTFIVFLTENFWIDDYEIEWCSEDPDFGELENHMYEKLEEKLLEEVMEKYNVR